MIKSQPNVMNSAARGAPVAPPDQARRAHLAMIALAALVATSFSFGSLIATTIAPVPLTFARFVIATFVFAGVMAATRTRIKVDAGLLYRALVLGFIYVAYFVTMFTALKTVSPLSTGAVFALAPLLSAAIGWLVLRRRLSPIAWTLLLIAGCGAVWVVFDGDLKRLASFHVGYGELIYFIGCLIYACYPTFLQKTARGDPAVLLTFSSFIAAMLLLVAWDGPAIIAQDWFALGVWQWAALVWLAVVPTAITFFLLQYASLRLPPAKVMAYTYLTPACIVPIEVVLGHGLPTLTVVAGIAVIVAALAAFEIRGA